MRIRNIFLSLLVSILVISVDVHEGYTQMPDQKFVGFPHRGKFVQFVPADEPDKEAAKKHFEELFLGKDLKFIRAVCRAEQEMEAEGKHDAQNIYCGMKTGSQKDSFEISYRFAVKDENGEPIPVALIWDILLGLKGEIVDRVEARVSILSP